MSEIPLLSVQNLKKFFPVRDPDGKKRLVHAVDDVCLSINRGETFGLVGESGSGKTTLGRTILRLLEPDSGAILYDGVDITHANMKKYRRKMQIVFQNPAGSLDPRSRVRDILAEGLRAGEKRLSRTEITLRCEKLLFSVGLSAQDMFRYPGEFSGGQQQRIGIARALAVEPEFIVCDEPVSALDVSYQSQIVNMFEDLREELGLTYLFISHDLSVVMHISDRIGVMYLGRLVEIGSREDIVLRPAHPYTRALLSAIPVPDPRLSRERVRLPAFIESNSLSGDEGCRYRARCEKCTAECAQAVPPLQELEPGHFCACCYI